MSALPPRAIDAAAPLALARLFRRKRTQQGRRSHPAAAGGAAGKVGRRTMDSVADPAPALASTTSVPAFWMRSVSLATSASLNSTDGLVCAHDHTRPRRSALRRRRWGACRREAHRRDNPFCSARNSARM